MYMHMCSLRKPVTKNAFQTSTTLRSHFSSIFRPTLKVQTMWRIGNDGLKADITWMFLRNVGESVEPETNPTYIRS
jgi:hypothetical protein